MLHGSYMRKMVIRMNNEKIAKILYGLSLGLDYADGIEYAEDEIACIANDLDGIGDSLKHVLENIAMQNECMEEFVDQLLERTE